MDISQKLLCMIFVYAAAVGAALGVVYDLFRIQRISMEPSRKLEHTAVMAEAEEKPEPFHKREWIKYGIIFVEDILFSLIAAVVITVMIFHMNSGTVRWFALAGAGVGFLLYYVTVGRLVMVCAEQIILFIRRVFAFLYKITVRPILKLCGMAGRAVYGRVKAVCERAYTRRMQMMLLRKASEGFKEVNRNGKSGQEQKDQSELLC